MTIKAEDILAVTTKVTKKWTKQRKAEERGSRSRYSRAYIYSDRVHFTDVADQILPNAYQHASGGGQYTVNKRNLFYACRESFKEKADRELRYGYFANTLLVQYMNRHPEAAGWKVTADPRGTLILPNAAHEVRVPVGTVQIDNYLREARRTCDHLDFDVTLPIQWPSLAPGQRYQGVLYIEKEGFEPMLQEARIAERFDLAVISCKGQSVVAARKFVDHVCAALGGVPLFVVHDFDKAGFEISQRLTSVSDWAEDNDRVTYRFRNAINVTDVGLRLADVEKHGLTGERCKFEGGFASDSIATEQEKKYLRSGRRVELNELTVPQFLEWLEGKLKDHLPKRLVPSDAVLADAYRRALAVARINRAIQEVTEQAIREAQDAQIPQALRAQIEEAWNADDTGAWDRVLYDLVADQAQEAGGAE